MLFSTLYHEPLSLKGRNREHLAEPVLDIREGTGSLLPLGAMNNPKP